jgi:integrase
MAAVSYNRFMSEVLEIYGNRRPATREKMRQVLAEFGALEGVRKTSDLKPVIVARWLAAHPDRRPATIDSLLRTFASAVMIGIESEYLTVSPIGKRSRWIHQLPRPGATEWHRTPEEIKRFLDLLDHEAAGGRFLDRRTRVLGYLYAFTGLRKMEGLGLRWIDVELEASLIHIRPHPARPLKTSSAEASLWIHPKLAPVLSDWRAWLERTWTYRATPWVFPNRTGVGVGFWQGGPPGSKPLDRIKAAGRRAGLDGLTILSFRKTIGTYARAWGLTPDELKRWLRHSGTGMQSYYREHDPTAERVELARIAGKIWPA